MNENQVTLLFIGIILGLFLLCAGLIVGISKYRELKKKGLLKSIKTYEKPLLKEID